MLGGEDDAASHAGLGKAREHCRKVEDKLRCRVRDNGYVAVVALCNLLVEMYLNLLLNFVHSAIVLLLEILCKDIKFLASYKIIAAKMVF